MISVRAGDVSLEMGLQDRVPAIISALDTERFLGLAGVVMEGRSGPPQSTTTIFVFRDAGSAGETAEEK